MTPCNLPNIPQGEFTICQVILARPLTEVAVFPDRLELLSQGRWVVVRFLDIARWRQNSWFYRLLIKLGLGIHGFAAVAERDWFHPPARRFFRFYTEPPITVYMADEPYETDYDETLFRRLQKVMYLGGFRSWDLG